MENQEEQEEFKDPMVSIQFQLEPASEKDLNLASERLGELFHVNPETIQWTRVCDHCQTSILKNDLSTIFTCHHCHRKYDLCQHCQQNENIRKDQCPNGYGCCDRD